MRAFQISFECLILILNYFETIEKILSRLKSNYKTIESSTIIKQL